MPKYTVTIRRIREETQYITVSASDDDSADQKAQEIIQDLDDGNPVKSIKPNEWELDDTRYEVDDISEE